MRPLKQKLRDVAQSVRTRRHSPGYLDDFKAFSELLIISLSSNTEKYKRLKEHHQAIVG